MSKEAWYDHQRAEVEAFVFLTRRTDIVPLRVGDLNRGYDLLVDLDPVRGDLRSIMAVEVKGRSNETITTREMNSRVFRIKLSPAISSIAIPLCLFVYIVDADTSYFSWLQEPIVDAEQGPILRPTVDAAHDGQTRIRMSDLTNEALEEIIQQTREWYRSQRLRSLTPPTAVTAD